MASIDYQKKKEEELLQNNTEQNALFLLSKEPFAIENQSFCSNIAAVVEQKYICQGLDKDTFKVFKTQYDYFTHVIDMFIQENKKFGKDQTKHKLKLKSYPLEKVREHVPERVCKELVDYVKDNYVTE